MTTEDDFHRALDAQPDDWHTRLVFADWLDERGDVRAAGYRAIAAHKRRPLDGRHTGRGRRSWWWHCPLAEGSLCHNDIPRDWFALLPARYGDASFWPLHTGGGGVRTRRQCEDALARAFAKLPPERQTELLAGPKASAREPSKPAKRRKSKRGHK